MLETSAGQGVHKRGGRVLRMRRCGNENQWELQNFHIWDLFKVAISCIPAAVFIVRVRLSLNLYVNSRCPRMGELDEIKGDTRLKSLLSLYNLAPLNQTSLISKSTSC